MSAQQQETATRAAMADAAIHLAWHEKLGGHTCTSVWLHRDLIACTRTAVEKEKAAARKALMAALAEVEWVPGCEPYSDRRFCPACDECEEDGHQRSCPVQSALAHGRGEA